MLNSVSSIPSFDAPRAPMSVKIEIEDIKEHIDSVYVKALSQLFGSDYQCVCTFSVLK